MGVASDSDDAALRYVREELSTLRGDITTVRTSIDTLARDLREFIAAQLPRLAVLEQRADDITNDITELRATLGNTATHDKRIADLETARTDERRARRQLVTGLAVGLILAVFSAVLAWLTKMPR